MENGLGYSWRDDRNNRAHGAPNYGWILYLRHRRMAMALVLCLTLHRPWTDACLASNGAYGGWGLQGKVGPINFLANRPTPRGSDYQGLVYIGREILILSVALHPPR